MPDGAGEWVLVKSVRNPWGHVPLTDGGRALSGRAREYMDRLLAQQRANDPVSRRHHYVPQSYLRQWSHDGRRVWSLDTSTGDVRQVGIKDVCVKENFYRVVGPDGEAHNRVELLFQVVDAELRRVQVLFDELDDPDGLEFDDLIGLGVTMAVQRTRTVQQRRIQLQYNAWMVAQNPTQFRNFDGGDDDPYRAAGIHTEMLFRAMWDSADEFTTRQIEVWHDPQGRFMTCDAPVLVPFRRNVRPSLAAAPYILWPVSPRRVVALSNDPQGEKAVVRHADGKLVGVVREAIQQGRERRIFASDEQHERLPKTKKFQRRAQARLRCSPNTPDGREIPPPGCCVEWSEVFAEGPQLTLCGRGLHSPAPAMHDHA
ncbi:MAG TPA: DUF4238 domain-containing protein [Ilumatobacter sp.]|nr:DUF4238 domain-containing protein [Ilumatobacter sp.]